MTNAELIRALRNDHPDYLTSAAADRLEAANTLLKALVEACEEAGVSDMAVAAAIVHLDG